VDFVFGRFFCPANRRSHCQDQGRSSVGGHKSPILVVALILIAVAVKIRAGEMDLSSWNASAMIYISYTPKSEMDLDPPAAAILKQGYRLVCPDEDITHSPVLIQLTCCRDIYGQGDLTFVAEKNFDRPLTTFVHLPNDWGDLAVASPRLGDKVGYFDEGGHWAVGAVDHFDLGWADDDEARNYVFFPALKDGKHRRLLTDPAVVSGKFGIPELVKLQTTGASDLDKLKQKMALYIMDPRNDDALDVVYNHAGAQSLLGLTPTSKAQVIEHLDTIRGLPWKWYGNTQLGIIIAYPASISNLYEASEYYLTFLVQDGSVQVLKGEEVSNEVLRIGKSYFIVAFGCKPDSDGCDQRVLEWFPGNTDRPIKAKKALAKRAP
jgi:hypothetical protein